MKKFLSVLLAGMLVLASFAVGACGDSFKPDSSFAVGKKDRYLAGFHGVCEI